MYAAQQQFPLFNKSKEHFMSVQETAYRRGLALIAASGAKYRILFGDEVETNIVEKPPTRIFSGVKYLSAYQAEIEAMAVGDVVTLTPPLAGTITALRGAAGAHAIRLWGKGSVITTIDRNKQTVEVLRVL